MVDLNMSGRIRAAVAEATAPKSWPMMLWTVL